ncbi:hypothetical protein QTP88_016402 [Uroleucon formosanum]
MVLDFGRVNKKYQVISVEVAKLFRYFDIKSKQTPINDGKYNIADLPSTKKIIRQNLVYLGINVIMIYLNEDYYPTGRFKFAVLVLENKVSFGDSFAPVCIDWYTKYDMKNEAQLKFIDLLKNKYINNDMIFIAGLVSIKFTHLGDLRVSPLKLSRAGLSFVHSNTYFLTGVIPMDSRSFDIKRNNKLLGLTDIKYYVPWIHGILNKHVYSHTILSHRTLNYQDFNITENCEVGYHKAYLYSYRICQGRGKWFSSSGKLCFYIKCTINEEYVNCSNLSKPNTIATTSCKTSYTSINEQEEERQELLSNSCILQTVEGVIYIYENSNESLSHGTLINHHQIVIESCELGYYKAYQKSYIVCQKSGKWEMAYDKLCLIGNPDKCNYGEILPLEMRVFSTMERREIRGLINELKLDINMEQVSVKLSVSRLAGGFFVAAFWEAALYTGHPLKLAVWSPLHRAHLAGLLQSLEQSSVRYVDDALQVKLFWLTISVKVFLKAEKFAMFLIKIGASNELDADVAVASWSPESFLASAAKRFGVIKAFDFVLSVRLGDSDKWTNFF